MPKEVKDIRDFLLMMKRKDVKSVIIHKKMAPTATTGRHISGGSKQITKFKIRGSRYLYTLTLDNKEKANKLATSLPSHLVKYTSEKKSSKKQ